MSTSTTSKEILPLLVELEQLQVILNYQTFPNVTSPSPITTPTTSSSSTSTSPSSSSSSVSLQTHESRIIPLASLLSYRLREFETSFSWSQLDSSLHEKLLSLILNYLTLMKQKQSSSCWKFCQCFKFKKSSHSQLSHELQQRSLEENYLILESKLIEGIFLLRANIIQLQIQVLLHDYEYLQQFSRILSDISSSTAFFNLHDDTIEGKYFCREKLRKLFYSLNEYKSEFLYNPRVGKGLISDDTTSGSSSPSSTNTPKRFRDIQEGLQISHENPNIKKEYRQINRYLHDLCILGTKLLLYKCEKKSDEVSNLLSMSRVIEHDQKDSFHALETAYSITLISKLTPNIALIQELIECQNHNISSSLVELAHRWSLLRANISSPTFLSSYFGSGDEDLDEMFPINKISNRPPMKPQGSSQKNLSGDFFTPSTTTTTNKSPPQTSSHVRATRCDSSDANDESFSLQMKKIFLDSFNNSSTLSTPPLPPPSHHSYQSTTTVSSSTSPSLPSTSFFTITADSNHSGYSNYSNHSMEDGGGHGGDGDSDERIAQFKNKFKSSLSTVAQKASKAAASAAAIASNSTQKAVSLASEAKNKVTSRPRRGSRGSGGLMMMTGSYTALVDMN